MAGQPKLHKNLPIFFIQRCLLAQQGSDAASLAVPNKGLSEICQRVVNRAIQEALLVVHATRKLSNITLSLCEFAVGDASMS